MDQRLLTNLTSRQRSVLAFYLRVTGVGAGAVQLHTAALWGTIGDRSYERREHIVAQVAINVLDSAPLHLYATLGDTRYESGRDTDHEHQFVAVIDEETADAVDLLAYARTHHELAGALDADSTFLLSSSSPLRRRGYTNALVTRADIYPPFTGRNDVEMPGATMRFLGVIPLESSEWDIKVARGTDALMDAFRRRGRDLLRLRR